MILKIFALVVIGILILVVTAVVVALGSLPGNIARKRQHPQADAIGALAWISLATGGLLWPIAFTWAFTRPGNSSTEAGNTSAELSARIRELEAELARLKSIKGST